MASNNLTLDGARAEIQSNYSAVLGNTDNVQQLFVVNGQTQLPGAATGRYAISNGIGVLVQSDMMQSQTSGQSTNRLSRVFLFTIGCTMTDEHSGFSLISNQTDEENIENVNILDEAQFQMQENDYIQLDALFQDPNDPFYEQDERLSQNEAAVHNNIINSVQAPDIIKLGAAISTLNFRSISENRLKYFNGPDIHQLIQGNKF